MKRRADRAREFSIVQALLARAGWDLLELQRMGRHSDPKTTLGYSEEFGPSRGETQRAREELEERQRREDRVVPLRRER